MDPLLRCSSESETRFVAGQATFGWYGPSGSRKGERSDVHQDHNYRAKVGPTQAILHANQNHGGALTRTKDGVAIVRTFAIKENQPTNHLGSTAIPERCFG